MDRSQRLQCLSWLVLVLRRELKPGNLLGRRLFKCPYSLCPILPFPMRRRTAFWLAETPATRGGSGLRVRGHLAPARNRDVCGASCLALNDSLGAGCASSAAHHPPANAMQVLCGPRRDWSLPESSHTPCMHGGSKKSSKHHAYWLDAHRVARFLGSLAARASTRWPCRSFCLPQGP